MAYWQILAVAGVVLVILEMLTPTMFFLNLALACFITAVVAVWTSDWNILVPVWVVASAVFLLFLRPLMTKKDDEKANSTGIGQYIGKKAKVLETVNADGGVIGIFDERWEARTTDGKEYKKGSTVTILKHDNLTMYVGKDK